MLLRIVLSLALAGNLSVFSAVAQTAPPQDSGPSVPHKRGFCTHATAPDQRPISWAKLVPNILCDQVPIWTFPLRVGQGHDLVPTFGFLGATTGLVLLDPSDAPYFRRTDTFHTFNNIFSGNNMELATILVSLGFYGVSLLRHDSYGQQTVLLAGEAVADSEILTTVMKDVDRRLRPSDVAPHGNFANTWFKSKGTWLRGDGSFPSGHEIAAISVATVFAERYRSHKWVPWVAYGAAGLIGFSRMTLSSHFPSDVFAGAVLGYSISRFVVLQEHWRKKPPD